MQPLHRFFHPRPRTSAKARPSRDRRLHLESLEARQLLTTVPPTMPFTLVNDTVSDSQGDLAFQDSQITIAIISQSDANGQSYYYNSAGQAFSTKPSSAPPTISQIPTFTLNQIAGGSNHTYTINLPTSVPGTADTGPKSARVYFSLNNPANLDPTPFVLAVNPDGSINGPAIGNGFVDYIEFSMNEPHPIGNINIDTSNVDQLSIPFKITVNSTDPGNLPDGVGIGVSRTDVFNQFQAFTHQVPNDPYASLVSTAADPTYGPYRIQNPTDLLKSMQEAQNLIRVQTITLNSLSASSTDTTLNVYCQSAFTDPTAQDPFAPFNIVIGGETMTVTAQTVNTDGTATWTVTRGATPTKHPHGSAVTVPQPSVSTTADMITVAGATGFPTTFPFNVLVDSEIMVVTGLLPSEIANGTNENKDGTTTWLVERGKFGTTAATHDDNATVTYASVVTSPFNSIFNSSIDALFTQYHTAGNSITLSSNGSGTVETYQGTVVQNAAGIWVLRFTDTSDLSDTTDYDIYYPFFTDNKLLWAGYTPQFSISDAPDWLAGANVDSLSPSQMVFDCNGVFADNTFREGPPTNPQGDNYNSAEAAVLADLEDQVVSALNRGVALSSSANWQDVSLFWGQDGNGQAWNHYAQFVHATPAMNIPGVPGVSINGQNYGFAFDDLANQASDISVASFTGATITLTPWSNAAPPPTTPANTLSAVVTPAGTSQVFAIGNDGQVWTQVNSGGQTQYALTQPGIVKQVSATIDGGGHIEVFALGMDDQVWYEAMTGNNSWSPWALTQSGKALQVALPNTTSTPGHLQVFILGQDHQVWYETRSAGIWSNWALTQAGQVQQISVLNRGQGNTDVFAVGSDNNAWYESTNGTSGWNAWASAASMPATQITAGLAPTSGGSNLAEVYGIQTNQSLSTATQLAAGGWSTVTPTQAGGVLAASAIRDANGRPTVYAIGADHQIWYTVFNTITELWSSWILTTPGTVR